MKVIYSKGSTRERPWPICYAIEVRHPRPICHWKPKQKCAEPNVYKMALPSLWKPENRLATLWC